MNNAKNEIQDPHHQPESGILSPDDLETVAGAKNYFESRSNISSAPPTTPPQPAVKLPPSAG